ncbi:MAG TPA: crossover junction endodeoxyribonuclease RuvC [Methylomirabilota bacterium]
MPSLRLLGVDPGLVGTGYGLIEPAAAGVRVVATGVVTTGAEAPLEARVAVIHEAIDRLLAEHAPGGLVLEDLYTEYRFPRTALQMAHARGVICLAARQRAVEVVTLAPAEVKRAVAGHGAASKAQVQEAVRRLLRLATAPRPSHVADALALALTALSRAGARLA